MHTHPSEAPKPAKTNLIAQLLHLGLRQRSAIHEALYPPVQKLDVAVRCGRHCDGVRGICPKALLLYGTALLLALLDLVTRTGRLPAQPNQPAEEQPVPREAKITREQSKLPFESERCLPRKRAEPRFLLATRMSSLFFLSLLSFYAATLDHAHACTAVRWGASHA